MAARAPGGVDTLAVIRELVERVAQIQVDIAFADRMRSPCLNAASSEQSCRG